MIAHQSTSDRTNEANSDESDSCSRSAGGRLTDIKLQVGTLKLPPMWEIKDLTVRFRVPLAGGPYASAFRLLVVLLAVLAVVAVVFHLTVP